MEDYCYYYAALGKMLCLDEVTGKLKWGELEWGMEICVGIEVWEFLGGLHEWTLREIDTPC